MVIEEIIEKVNEIFVDEFEVDGDVISPELNLIPMKQAKHIQLPSLIF